MPQAHSTTSADQKRTVQSAVYADYARVALAEAKATDLPNVKRRFLIAAKRWIQLAEHARRVEERHAGDDEPGNAAPN